MRETGHDLLRKQSSSSHSDLKSLIPSVFDVEGRLFEDPMYLMQYNLVWHEPPDNIAESVENAAFVRAENEIYLRKVQSATLHFPLFRGGRFLDVRRGPVNIICEWALPKRFTKSEVKGQRHDHLSFDVCLEVRGEIIRTVLCCGAY